MKISHGDRQSFSEFSLQSNSNSQSKQTAKQTGKQTGMQKQHADVNPPLSNNLRRDGQVDILRGQQQDLMGKGLAVADLVEQMSNLSGMQMPERTGLAVPDIGAPPDGKPQQPDNGGTGDGDGDTNPLDQILEGTPGGGFRNGSKGVSIEEFENMLLGNRGQLGAEYDAAVNEALTEAGIPTGLGAAFGVGSGAANDAAEQSALDQARERAGGGTNAPAGKPNPMNFNNAAEMRMGMTSQEADGDGGNDNGANGANNGNNGSDGDNNGGGIANAASQAASAAVNAVTSAAKGAASAVAGFVSNAAMTILTSNGDPQTKGDEVIGLGVFSKWAKGEEVSMGSIKDPRQGGNGTTERTTGEDDGPKFISADMIRRFESKKEGLVNRLEPEDYDHADAAAKVAQAAALQIASVINIDPDSDQPQTDGEIKLPENPLVDPVEPDTPDGIDVDVPDVHPGQIGPNVGGGRGPRGGLTM